MTTTLAGHHPCGRENESFHLDKNGCVAIEPLFLERYPFFERVLDQMAWIAGCGEVLKEWAARMLARPHR